MKPKELWTDVYRLYMKYVPNITRDNEAVWTSFTTEAEGLKDKYHSDPFVLDLVTAIAKELDRS